MGETYYTDRDFVLTQVPPELSDGCLVKTPNDDKNSQNALYLTVSTSRHLWVCYDNRAMITPAWLDGTVKVIMETTDTGNNHLICSPTAERVLPGNGTAFPGAGSNYIVVVK